MEITAFTKSAQISPRKARLVADSIKKRTIAEAFDLLGLADKRAASILLKTLRSAVANAVNNKQLKPDNLSILKIDIGEGPVLKRFHPASRGRAHPFKKRTSHIKITLKNTNNNTKHHEKISGT